MASKQWKGVDDGWDGLSLMGMIVQGLFSMNWRVVLCYLVLVVHFTSDTWNDCLCEL